MVDDLKIRCFCIKRTLLAVCGRDRVSGEPFVHIKVHKQARIMANVVVTSGTARLQCRDCGRWHRVRIVRTAPEIIPEDLPKSIVLG